MPARTRRPPATTIEVLDRSNTNPICPACEYRTVAIDRCRVACRHCGTITHHAQRIVRHLVNVFAGTIIIDGGSYADRA